MDCVVVWQYIVLVHGGVCVCGVCVCVCERPFGFEYCQDTQIKNKCSAKG